MKDEWVGTTEASRMLGVSYMTVINWANRDLLPCVRMQGTRCGQRLFSKKDIANHVRRAKVKTRRDHRNHA